MPSSKIDHFDGMPIIHDTVPTDHLFPADKGRGLDMRGRPREGPAYAGVATAFPPALLIPRSEIQARVQERKERKITNRQVIDASGLPPKDQQQTNYCWINSPACAVESTRVLQNQEKVILSPASAGAQIKNYRNVGGWGKEALDWVSVNGFNSVDRWPANAIDRRYATADNKAQALNYRPGEWTECDVSNMDQVFSLLLHGIVGCSGLAWWSHEVTYIDVDWVDGQPVIVFRNSWGPGYGNNGYGVLQGQRMQPDDYVAPRSAIAA